MTPGPQSLGEVGIEDSSALPRPREFDAIGGRTLAFEVSPEMALLPGRE